MELSAQLVVNGASIGTVDSFLPVSGGRNGYLRIDAGPGETIFTVGIENGELLTTGDGLAFDHVAFQVVPEPNTLALLAVCIGSLAGVRLRRCRMRDGG